MAANTKTVGAVVNSGLMAIGEPKITDFTSTNIIQSRLIEAANNAVRDIRERFNPDWVYKRTTLQLVADVTTEYAAATNGSASITSVDEDGNAAENWGSDIYPAGSGLHQSYFRMNGDLHSYRIESVTTAVSPDIIVLEDAYRGTTTTAGGYRILTDTYKLPTTVFAEWGQLQRVVYGDAQAWTWGLTASVVQDRTVEIVSIEQMLDMAGGDLHRDTSGRPRYIAEIAPISPTAYPATFVVWPFPTENWILTLWYSTEYYEAESFSTVLFDSEAPASAYDAVEHAVVSEAHILNEDLETASIYGQKSQIAIANLIRRENRTRKDASFDVATYRKKYGINYPVRSGIWFDTKPAART